MSLTRQRKNLLFSGYTRSYFTHEIPKDIICLLGIWLSSAAYMIIEHDKTKQFLSKKINECMELKIMFKITDKISFECSLFPLGKSNYNDSYVIWCVKPIITSPDLEEVRVNFECGCDEIENSLFKERDKFDEDSPIRDLPMIFPTKCKDKDKLSFYIDIDLVRYKNTKLNKCIYHGVSPIFHSKFQFMDH